MSYDKLLYAAYGYLDETTSDDTLRRLERNDDGNTLNLNFLKLMAAQVRAGIITQQEGYWDYLSRLAYAVERLPVAYFNHSYATDGRVDVSGKIGKGDYFNVLYSPLSGVGRSEQAYLRFTYFHFAVSPRGNGMIQIVAKKDGSLTVEYPTNNKITGTYHGGNVPYTSAKELIADAEKKFPIILKGKLGPGSPAGN